MMPGRSLDQLIEDKIFNQPVNVVVEVNEGIKPLPHYSTDIKAAWLVVDKDLIESIVRISDGRWFARCVINDRDEDYNEAFRPGFNLDNGYYEIPIYDEPNRKDGAFGETAPHAICLAALKAVEGKQIDV